MVVLAISRSAASQTAKSGCRRGPVRERLGHVRGLMNTSQVITDRCVYDAYPLSGGGGSDPRGALTPRRNVVGHARRRPLRASGNYMEPLLHAPSSEGGTGSVEGNPFALVPSMPDARDNKALRASALRFRWNGSYPEFSRTGGYRTLYLLTGQQNTPTAAVMHVGAHHYSPSLRRWLQRDPVRLDGGSPNLYQYCAGNPVSFVDPSGLCQLILHVNPGGASMGSHLLIGLVADDERVTWVSFYPEEPSGKKNKRETGPGVVSFRKPTEGGRGVVFDITPEQYRRILAAVLEDQHGRVTHGKGKRYSLTKYNCVDWADEMLSSALGTERYPLGGNTSKPKKYIDIDWFPGENKLGEWRPGDQLPVRLR